jgi:SH3 domain protein
MKQLCVLILTLGVTISCFAEETSNADTDNTSPIGQRYIRDYIYVPLRTGDSSSHRIVHKGLKSGTEVTLIKENVDGSYGYVKTNSGIEGWMPTQYLMDTIPTSVKLTQAESSLEKLSAQAGPDAVKLVDVQAKNDELAANMHTLEETNNTLSRELEHIKSLSSDKINLNEENKKLLLQYENSKREKDTLTAENQSLKDQLSQNTFINGAIAVILGMLGTIIIQYFAKSKKRHSDWA